MKEVSSKDRKASRFLCQEKGVGTHRLYAFWKTEDKPILAFSWAK
jgi:hypothetical protein